AEVSIALAPDLRGRGIGRVVLAMTSAAAAARGIRTIVASIRPENVASLRAFAAAGYAERGRDGEMATFEREVAEADGAAAALSDTVPE
ncbi:MAG: Acetyltransferase domain, partial [Solirubrobacteraceae bacterium]|nr:Acetyltransferase domain [Solirubrobacteraceae bacterium]